MPEDSYGIQTVEFVVRPTSFSNFDVSATGTKALEGDALTAVERKIVNAYFLVFDKDGERVDFRTLTPRDNQIPSQILTDDYGKGPIKVCYLANVSADVAESYTTWDDVLTKPLAITYPEYNAEYFSTTGAGHIGIPTLNGELCFPMFGTETYPGTTANNGVVEVQLKRLFAKVVVNLMTDLDADLWEGLFDAPEINIFSYTITNLPTNVLIADESRTNSPWVNYGNTQSGTSYFKEPISVDIEDITINNNIFSTFTHILTLYVPEYYLEGTAEAGSNTDQKRKPQMYASNKRPVYLTIDGLAHQTNYVDVPLKYNIYFGGDATGNFDLLRNAQYNNNMTITGTTEAILGEDDRVEATYHNLANPDNIGEDVPANCYIISKPGRYLIPTYIGNDVSGGTKEGTSVEQVQLNGGNNTISNIHLQKIDGKNYIQFDVNMDINSGELSLNDVLPANKLMVLKSGSDVVWSWHLWFCEDFPNDHTYPGNVSETIAGSIVMDRAIGAITSNTLQTLWADGMYFQWGRKDPMLANTIIVASGASYENSIQNYQTFYSDWETDNGGWSDIKTVNDPCPPGYKVPQSTVWLDSAPNIDDSTQDSFCYSTTIDSLIDEIYYPYSSYLQNNNGELLIIENTPLLNSDGKDQLNSATHTTLGVDWYVQYSGTETVRLGHLWNLTGCIYFNSQVFNINEADAKVFYDAGWRKGNVSISSLSNIPFIGNMIGDMVIEIMENAKAAKREYAHKDLGNEENQVKASSAAHVRCVKE